MASNSGESAEETIIYISMSELSGILPEINRQFGKSYNPERYGPDYMFAIVKRGSNIILVVDFLPINRGIKITKILSRNGGVEYFKKLMIEYQNKYDLILLNCPVHKIMKYSKYGFSIAKNNNYYTGQKMFLMVWVAGFEKYDPAYKHIAVASNHHDRFPPEYSGIDKSYCRYLHEKYGPNTWSVIKVFGDNMIVNSTIFKADNYGIRVLQYSENNDNFTITMSMTINQAVMKGLPAIFPGNDVRADNKILELMENPEALKDNNLIQLSTKIISDEKIRDISRGKPVYQRHVTI